MWNQVLANLFAGLAAVGAIGTVVTCYRRRLAGPTTGYSAGWSSSGKKSLFLGYRFATGIGAGAAVLFTIYLIHTNPYPIVDGRLLDQHVADWMASALFALVAWLMTMNPSVASKNDGSLYVAGFFAALSALLCLGLIRDVFGSRPAWIGLLLLGVIVFSGLPRFPPAWSLGRRLSWRGTLIALGLVVIAASQLGNSSDQFLAQFLAPLAGISWFCSLRDWSAERSNSGIIAAALIALAGSLVAIGIALLW